MTAPTGKCPDCGKPTEPLVVKVARRTFSHPVRCQKCVESAERLALERQNQELGRQDQERISSLQAEWEAKFPALYCATDPNHPAIDQDLLAKILEWHPAKAGRKGIGLHGPTGGCKTRMMFLLLRKLHFLGTKVDWVHAIKLARASFEQFDSENGRTQKRARTLLENLAGAGILLIDDIGKERFTDSVEQNLYWLIETRILNGRPTLWTSNASGATLRELTSDNRGPALTRRLAEFSTVYFVPARHERAESIEHLAGNA